jgi:serine/threonine-protein kinase
MTAQPTQPRLGGHRLLREIGQGTNGTVHLAQPPGDAPVVALKLVRLPAGESQAAAAHQFGAAAQAAARLHHPSIVQVFEHGVEGDWAWVTMEPVPGTDLSRYTQSSRLLPEALVLLLGARLAEALAYAHRQGLVHRDVKPANVLVNWATDEVKLADFGLARGAWAANTGTGIVPGSPAYMSPEQLAGMVAGAPADLYALGVTIFELLSGRRPHDAQNMGELLRQVALEQAPSLLEVRPGLHQGVAELVAKLLRKAPAERPADGDTVAFDLRQLAAAIRPAV